MVSDSQIFNHSFGTATLQTDSQQPTIEQQTISPRPVSDQEKGGSLATLESAATTDDDLTQRETFLLQKAS